MILNPAGGSASSQWLIKEWCLRLGQSIEAMTGEPGQVSEQADASAAPQPGSWWCQPFSIAPDCRVWIGAPEASQKLIGKKVLAGAGIEDCSDEDQISTYREILQQALAGLAHGLSGLTGREVTAAAGAESPDGPSHAVLLDIVFAGETPAPLLFGWSAETLDHVDQKPAPPKAKAAAAAERPSAAPMAAEPAPSSNSAPATGRTIDLLYDVELPVAVSFGRAHLPLKEVLKLTSGSIIELNRTVNEPVEIIINNCVIARGEVVVVDGNYGVRIQQIISKSERLRTLH